MDEVDQYRYQLAKGYLDWVGGLAARIAVADDAARSQRATIDGLRGRGEGEAVSGTRDPHRIEQAVAILEELEALFVDEVETYAVELAQAKRAIARLKNGNHVRALTAHYVNGDPWRIVERDMHYSHDGMMSLRRAATIALYEFIPPRWKTPKAAE